MATKINLVGPKGQLYADPQPSPDEVTFKQDNTSAEYYNSPYHLAHKTQVQPIPERRNNLPLNLAPLEPGVDFGFLARQFDLAGGNIRNPVLVAAFLAVAAGGAQVGR